MIQQRVILNIVKHFGWSGGEFDNSFSLHYVPGVSYHWHFVCSLYFVYKTGVLCHYCIWFGLRYIHIHTMKRKLELFYSYWDYTRAVTLIPVFLIVDLYGIMIDI